MISSQTNTDKIPDGKQVRGQKKPARVQTPTVLQMEAVECGAASLSIILQYFGKYLPLEILRVDCGVTRDGSKASNILKAARNYGLTAQGYRKEPEQLKDMPVPMIIHWNFNHFVVLEGFKKGKVYLNDPNMGPRVVTEEEFDQAFTGVAITFAKGPDFVPGGEKRSMLGALKKRLAGSEKALLFTILVGLMLVIPGLAIPLFTQLFIDNILLARMENWLFPLILGLLLTGLVRVGLTWLQQYYLLRFETRLTLGTSGHFFWHILRLPVDFFSQRYAGDVGTRVMINDRVSKTVSRDLTVTVLNLIMIVFYLVIMLQYSILLTFVGVLVAFANILYLRLVSRKRVDQNQKLLQEQGKLQGTSMAGLQIIETLKAGGIESDFFSVWAGTQAKVANFEQQFKVSSTHLSSVPEFLQGLNMAVILAFGGLAVINGQMTIGMLVAFQFLMASFITPVNDLVNKGSELQELEGDLNRLDDVLRYPVDTQWEKEVAPNLQTYAGDNQSQAGEGDKGSVPNKKLSGKVVLNEVSFGYSKLDAPLIENFSMELNPGERVALVGGSGSGKSTIAKLITGIFQPWSGEILFDGMRREAIPRHVLTSSLTVVDQDISMFSGTIWENITLWDDTKDELSVARAVRDSCSGEIIAERPSGYEYELEEGGRNFSGGQLQRLEIARALVSDPTIMVLDEATSALDPKTEQEVSEYIRQRGCTCIIVAHRLSTIRDCDEIIVLARGKVAERGTHTELKDRGGVYANLIADM